MNRMRRGVAIVLAAGGWLGGSAYGEQPSAQGTEDRVLSITVTATRVKTTDTGVATGTAARAKTARGARAGAGKTAGALAEALPVGTCQQPEWTLHRRFPTTRVYLQQDQGDIAVSQWWRTKYPAEGYAKHQFREEVEIGLPYRMQMDLYLDWNYNPTDGAYYQDVAPELRWALADWRKIPLNPTLYGEWKFTDPERGPDLYELKILFGDQFSDAWHWGWNAIYEQEVGGARETEVATSAAVSYTLADQLAGVGVEAKYAQVTEQGGRGEPSARLSLGPSVQWRLTRRLHLDLVALFGLSEDAPDLETFVILGWDIHKQSSQQALAPVSMKAE
jgi:hypothetical protein